MLDCGRRARRSGAGLTTPGMPISACIKRPSTAFRLQPCSEVLAARQNPCKSAQKCQKSSGVHGFWGESGESRRLSASHGEQKRKSLYLQALFKATTGIEPV